MASTSLSGEPAKSAEPPSETPDNPPRPVGPLRGSKLTECLKSGRPTMADFGLGTCKTCKAMQPILKQAAQDYWGKANIVFVELDKYPELAREYRIAVMPTQIFLDAEGKQVDSHMGYMDRAEIDRRLTALGVER
jgi:thioredoxin 1